MKLDERKEAIRLRRKGFSIKVICEKLHVAKSSVFRWVEDVKLTDAQKNKLTANSRSNIKHLAGFSEKLKTSSKANRDAAEKHGFERAETDTEFKIICALYWGEGTKSSRNSFCITNCDHAMINLVGKWLSKEGFSSKIRFTIHLHDPKNIQDATSYWLEKCKWLKEQHFTKSIIYNRSGEVHRQPYGTIKLSVHNTALIQSVFGGIRRLKEMGD